MRRHWIAVGIFLSFLSTPALGESFSLFGVSFGMTRAEVREKWVELETGEYHIREAALLNLRPAFDHQERLYKLSFSIPITDKYPFELVSAAYQGMIHDRWGGNPRLAISVRTGRSTVDATITDKTLKDEYAATIAAELSGILRP